MKLFLKSIAFFASVALLFTACTEDDTTDAAGAGANPEVESSSIESAVAGNGKIQLKWDVPRDENITACRILWSAGVFSGEKDVIIADLSEGEKAQFSDDYITITDTLELSAGLYTISILNVGDVDLDTEAVTYDGEIDVYDSSTYTTHATESKVEYTDDNILNITWATIPPDLTAMTVTYSKDSSDATSSYTTTERFVAEEGGVTSIPDVKRDSYYTITSYFRPEGALDGEDEYVVLLDDDTTRAVPENNLAASAPKSVTLQPGDGRIKITWSVPEGTEMSTIEVYRADFPETVNDELYFKESDYLLVGEDKTNVLYIGNTIEINGSEIYNAFGAMNPIDYIVKIYNTYNTDAESERISETTSVYDSTTYESKTPTVDTSGYADNVVITWDSYEEDDFVKLEIVYNGDVIATVTGSENISNAVDFDFVDNITSFTYKSYFQPADGLDLVSVSSSEKVITAATSVDISYTSGTNTCSIATAKGLKAFADLVNGNDNTSGAMTSGLSGMFGTKSVSLNGELAASIDLSTVVGEIVESAGGETVSWEPITNYSGTFNGGNHTIDNLYIKAVSKEQGFFGTTDGATITNIKLVDPMIEVWGNKGYVGGIAGKTSSTTITSCQVYASSSSSSWITVAATYPGSASGNYQGGLVGMATSTTITSSYNYGVPVANQTGGSNVGGLVGSMSSSSSVALCVNTGDVSVSINSNLTCLYTAGLVGYLDTSYISNSINAGAVTTNNQYSGGIAGYSKYGVVYGCSNYGDVTSALGYVGGVVGAQYTTGPKVYYCKNEGDITGGGVGVGGIVGWSGQVGEVNGTGGIDSSWSAYITEYTSTDGIYVNGTVGTPVPGGSYNNGSVTGTTNVGGICGTTETTATSEGTCGIWNYENKSSEITGTSTTRVAYICPGNTSGANAVEPGDGSNNTYTGN